MIATLIYILLSYVTGFVWLIVGFSVDPNWNDEMGPGPLVGFVFSPIAIPFIIPFMTARCLGKFINSSDIDWKQLLIKKLKNSMNCVESKEEN